MGCALAGCELIWECRTLRRCAVADTPERSMPTNTRKHILLAQSIMLAQCSVLGVGCMRAQNHWDEPTQSVCVCVSSSVPLLQFLFVSVSLRKLLYVYSKMLTGVFCACACNSPRLLQDRAQAIVLSFRCAELPP